MIKQVCAVMDSAAQVFGAPMFVPANGVAVRAFQNEVARVDVNNQLNQHPQDFVLFHIASFDDETGGFVNVVPPVQLLRAVDVPKG